MKNPADTAPKIDPKVWVLAAVLVLALLGVGLSWRLSQMPAAPSASAASTSSSAEQMSQETSRLLAAVEAAQAKDAQVLETNWRAAEAPQQTAPAAAARPEEKTFHLRGVVRGGSQPVVFLDDKTLMVGDEIDGYTLTEIAADHVTLVDPQGKESRLSLEGVE